MDQLTLRPLPFVSDRLGMSRTAIYREIGAGLITRPIRLGASRRWPEHEISRIVAAHIAGKNDDEIRALVQQLHEARASIAAEAA